MEDSLVVADDSVGVGVVGLGVMGNRMIASLQRHDAFHVVGVWDQSTAAMAATAATHPELGLAGSADELLRTDGVDLVYIATPPHAHSQYAHMAIDAGHAVYCEKPLGVDIAESERLTTRCAETSTPNAVNFPFAATPPIDHIERLLAAWSPGDVVAADVILHFVPWPREWQQSARWLSARADGGFLREVGSHFIFLIERLFGRATLTDSSVSFPEDGWACETRFDARLDCAGVEVNLSGSALGAGPDVVEMTIWGRNQSIRLSNWSEVLVSDGGPWRAVSVYGSDVRSENNTRFFGELRRVVGGQPNTIASFADALSVQRIVEAVLTGGD